MRKIMVLMLAALAATVVSGCASVCTAQKFNDQKLTLGANPDVAHVNGANWGLYFLKWPCMTGSTVNPGDMSFGENTVTVESVVDMVTTKGKEMGGVRMVDLQSERSCFWIPPMLVFFIKSVEVSGNAVK